MNKARLIKKSTTSPAPKAQPKKVIKRLGPAATPQERFTALFNGGQSK